MMCSCRARPRRKHANSSATKSAILLSTDHGRSQTRIALTSKPGAINKKVKRITRRSKRVRRDGVATRFSASLTAGREPIFFHPPVQGAAAQAKRFGGLADIALKALQRFADQNTFDRLQTQFLQILHLHPLDSDTEVGGLQLVGAAHEHGALHSVL